MVLLKYSITDGLLQTSIAMMDANKNYNAAHKVWVKGMMDMKLANGQPIYPDANSTLRLTYGQVLPYAPADGVKYDYYTTLKGAMEKEDPDNWEFVVPAKLKQLYQAKDFGRYAMPNGEMPICFIVNTDNTGGNSGSPVFNAKGELIGTGFRPQLRRSDWRHCLPSVLPTSSMCRHPLHLVHHRQIRGSFASH